VVLHPRLGGLGLEREMKQNLKHIEQLLAQGNPIRIVSGEGQ